MTYIEADLKPCPFCGGQAEIKQTGKLQITVRCKSCLMGLTQKAFRYSLDWLEVKMKENWNQRIYQHDRKRDLAPGYEVKTDLEKHLAVTLTLVQKERDALQSRIEQEQQQIATEINVRDGVIAMYDFLLEENCELREKLKRYEH